MFRVRNPEGHQKFHWMAGVIRKKQIPIKIKTQVVVQVVVVVYY